MKLLHIYCFLLLICSSSIIFQTCNSHGIMTFPTPRSGIGRDPNNPSSIIKLQPIQTYRNNDGQNGKPLKAKYQCTLQECYPKTVAEIGYSAGGAEVPRLNVSMAYRKWTDTTIPEGLGSVGAHGLVASTKSYDPSTGVFATESSSGGNLTLPNGNEVISL